MMEPAFYIKDLHCSYPGADQVVLQIPKLEVPYGKLIVFLGASGVGKSTLLETLGLMNHTIKQGEVRFNEEAQDFRSLWLNRPEHLPGVRSKYMSFVFQENNLLDNLGALDNILISHMIQGKTRQQALALVHPWLKYLNMEFVLENPSARHLSVGQKQRLSFIRAASVDFAALFGDEPTGNLDEVNGEVLMACLRAEIRKKPRQRLAIIVSHNIDLSLKSADMIYVITKDNKDSSGRIRPEHIFYSETTLLPTSDESVSSHQLSATDHVDMTEHFSWYRQGTNESVNPRKEIVELLKTRES